MSSRPQYAIVDKSSTVPGVAGAALAKEFATQAFPESNNKRQVFNMKPLAPTAGATPQEAFIDGIQGFRFVLADRSTCILKILASYNNNVSANNTGFELTVAATNIGGTIALAGTQLVVKYPGASTASLVVTTDNATQALVFTVTGVAGDSNGQWDIRCIGISEVTDLG